MPTGQGRLSVGRAGRRVEGPVERELRRTLAAWSRQAHLVGDDNAGVRSALRLAARNVDAAFADHDTSPYVRGQLVRWYNDMLTAHQPPQAGDTPTDDPWTVALRDLAPQ